MSSFVYGVLGAQRDRAPAKKSKTSEPPAMGTYVDTLTGLVPAEALAFYEGIVLPSATKAVTLAGKKVTVISHPSLLVWSCAGLLLLSSVLYAIGSKKLIPTTWLDVPRLLVPPAALAAWMLVQTPGVWDIWWPSSDTADRVVVTAFAAVGLGILAKGLGYLADKAPAPAVTRVRPKRGPPAGGNKLTVTGKGFTRATLVSFDRGPGQEFKVLSDTKLTVTSPAENGSPTVNVTVTTPDGTSDTSAHSEFTYANPAR